MRSPKQRGLSTIEILIAFAILTLALSAVVIVVFGSQSLSVDSQTNTEALYRAQTLLENARAASRADFSSLVSIPQYEEQSGAMSYTKKLDVMDIDFFTKQATSTVSWLSGGRTLSIVLSTLLTNPGSAVGGDTCSPTVVGDWTNPQLLGSADIGENNGGTDVDVFNRKAYVTANASAAAKHDFYIIDVSDPTLTNLTVLGSLDTGPGLASVSVAGRYAYVANMSTTAQLQVIDILNPSAPSVVASLDVTSSGDSAVGNTIFYDNKKVYLGLDRPSLGEEFYVIDVSDPLNPHAIASFEINSKVNAIREKDGAAYLAVPDDPSTAAAEQLRVLDVSQANSGIVTQLSAFYGAPNPSTMSGEGLYLSKDGDTLYLGEGGANSGHKPDLFVLNVSDPSSISIVDSKYVSTSNNVTVTAAEVRSDLVFLWTSDTNLGFQVYDLDDFDNATPYGSLNTEQTATGGFDCEGNYIFTAQRSNDALQVIGPYIAQPFTFALENSGDVSVEKGTSVNSTITVSRETGSPVSVPLSVSFSPAATGLSGTLSPASCKPNSVCQSTLAISTTAATPAATYEATVSSAGVTTRFNVDVTEPFAYTLSASPASLSFTKASPGTETITVTKTSGTAQAVTVSLSVSGSISASPSSGTCAPVLGTCQLTFTVSTNGASHKAGTITVNGSPNAATTAFSYIAN